MNQNIRRFHFNTAVKIVLLLGFAAFYLYTLATGSVNLYVHPRIIPYIIFAAAAMVIIAFLLIGELFRPDGKRKSAWPLLFFVIPLIMSFAIPAEAFDGNTGTAGEVQISTMDSATGEAGPAALPDTTPSADSTASPAGEASENAGADDDLQNSVLVFTDDNYYVTLYQIYAELDDYVGKEVELTGFVYRGNEDFSEDEFVAARLLMICCAADMQTVGLMCRWDGGAPEADTWVKVTGSITTTEYNGETVPIVEAENVEVTDSPDVEYIYPFN